MMETTSTDPIIAVDLDGSLVLTDTLHETVISLLRVRPWCVLNMLSWLMNGKAAFKQTLANYVQLDVALLPYNTALLKWLRAQKASGRQLVLCTATDQHLARAIASHLGLFDAVLASDGTTNLAGPHKRAVLESKFGHRGFDYVGNSRADLKVWPGARRAILVNAPRHLTAKVARLTEVERTFRVSTAPLSIWLQALRIHQWAKNLLLFVPLVAAHQLTDPSSILRLVLAFIAFSLLASGVYIANDLVDLENDRRHPRKRHRPFASGSLAIAYGVWLLPVSAVLSVAFAVVVGMKFTFWLLVYASLTSAYSLWLKRLLLIDCLTLAALYTLRIMAGASAVAIPLSFWLLTFSIFLFLSLAFVKRYAELQVQAINGNLQLYGRGYVATDAPLIQTLGIAAGYAAVVVLALYIHGEKVVQLYQRPEMLGGIVPLMLFWISWMWMKAHRGQMHDDPLVFALSDKMSLGVGMLFLAIFALATLWGGFQVMQ